VIRFIRSLPFALEFAAVMALALGLFVFSSIWVVFHPSSHTHHSIATLIRLVFYELGVFAVLLPLLRLRGWTFAKIGLRPTLRDTGIGIALFAAAYCAWAGIWFATVVLSPSTAMNILAAPVMVERVPLALTIAVSLVNSLFEEIWVSGYLMTALKRSDNPWFAIHASVAVRLVYHLYQGTQAVLSIIPIGLIFGIWYARTGRLWPLVVAHALMDLFALLAVGR